MNLVKVFLGAREDRINRFQHCGSLMKLVTAGLSARKDR